MHMMRQHKKVPAITPKFKRGVLEAFIFQHYQKGGRVPSNHLHRLIRPEEKEAQ
jgi:hypothetical protein